MLKYFSFIFSCLTVCTSVAKAQEQLPEFGKISLDELQMKECSFENDAAAMYLIDEETAEMTIDSYTGDAKIEYKHRARLKIFNEKGYKYASIVIPYSANKRYTKLIDVDAVMYGLDKDGKIKDGKIDDGKIDVRKIDDRKIGAGAERFRERFD